RAAAQQGADDGATPAWLAPRQGLGGDHRAGDPDARRPRQAAGRDPVGRGRPQSAAVPRRRADDRVGPPIAALGGPGLLRLPAVQRGERPPAAPGRAAGRLAAALAKSRAANGSLRRTSSPTRQLSSWVVLVGLAALVGQCPSRVPRKAPGRRSLFTEPWAQPGRTRGGARPGASRPSGSML